VPQRRERFYAIADFCLPITDIGLSAGASRAIEKTQQQPGRLPYNFSGSLDSYARYAFGVCPVSRLNTRLKCGMD
jgi:hypothetical protein